MTKCTSLLSMIALALVTATGVASAQPSTTPATDDPNPPANGALSHINGTPVKVGEHREYYYGFKRWNVSSNPIGWLVGSYSVSGSYAVHRHVALRADVNVYNLLDDGGEGYELGIGAPIYFRHMYSGFFLEPGLIVREFDDDSVDDADKTYGPQLLIGWHWTWDSGLNVAMAAGLGRDLSDDDNKFDDGGPFVNGYFRIGYNF